MLEVIWVELHLPQTAPALAGFVLLETRHGRLIRSAVRMLADWSLAASEEDREVLAGMEELIRTMLEQDPEGGLAQLEQASNVIRCSARLQLPAADGDLHALASGLARLLLGAEKKTPQCRTAEGGGIA